MKRRERSYECEVCGQEHVHSVLVYQFDTSEFDDLPRTIPKGPINLFVDRFRDWFVHVDDGYTQVDQYWDEDADVIVVEVVEHED